MRVFDIFLYCHAVIGYIYILWVQIIISPYAKKELHIKQ